MDALSDVDPFSYRLQCLPTRKAAFGPLRMLTKGTQTPATSIRLPLAHSPESEADGIPPRRGKGAFLDLPEGMQKGCVWDHSPVNASHAAGTTLPSFTKRKTPLMFLLLLALLLLLLGALLLCTQMHWVASAVGP